jgi:signal transduction histidine kinase
LSVLSFPTQLLDDQWPRRLSRRPAASAAVAALCLAALGALVAGDLRTDPSLTFGALQVVPLAVAGWLLAPGLALAITAAAAALRIVVVAAGAVHPVTGVIQAVVGVGVGLLVVALAGSARARTVMERRARGIRRLTRLLDALRSLGPETDPVLGLGEILAAAAAVFGDPESEAPRTFLAVIDGDRLRVALERNRTGGQSLVGESFALRDAPGLIRVLDDGGSTTTQRRQLRGAARQMAARADVATMISSRVRGGGEAHGLLCVAFPEERWFDTEELRFLQAMAHLAGMAVDAASAVTLERRQSDELRRRAEHITELEGMKREFLLLASHELRSPLAVARGYAAMLREGSLGKPPPSFRRPLAIMEDKLAEMSALVDDMLETARLETGKLDLVRDDVDLRQVVENAVAQVQTGLSERHHLEVDLPGRPVVVRGDTERLRRIAVNLLDNAVKYSPDGGAVSCMVDADDRHAEVRVQDHGLGIAAEAQARMFQRFGRIVTPLTSHIPGTGLGLYLCRELARAHGGDVTVESREGEGSTFTLTLPLGRPATPN